MRKAPEKKPAEESKPLQTKELLVTYRFLTPVFGGGIEVDGPKKPFDPVTPIRVASLRGQLRFWWRACNPAGCKDAKELFKEEAKIFGSTQTASPLSIDVRKQPGRPTPLEVFRDRFKIVDERHGRAYGAFPLRAEKGKTDHGVLHAYAEEWTIGLRYPAALEKHVQAMLWAFAHFGGLGGRTRRGFGAVQEMRRSAGALKTLEAGWPEHVGDTDNAQWPHLPTWKTARWRRVKGLFKQAVDAHEHLLDRLRRLRQGELGRKQTADDTPGKHPGRSYWPEPDAIRKKLGRSAPDHRRPVTQGDFYPRAVFGLPIVFHFKDQKDPSCHLLPKGKTRWASPLLLRPHQEGSLISALAVVLEPSSPPQELVLKDEKNEAPVSGRAMTENDALHVGLHGRPSPFMTRRGTIVADPLDRFLEEI